MTTTVYTLTYAGAESGDFSPLSGRERLNIGAPRGMLSASLGQVRVTFKAGTTLGITCGNASIGIALNAALIGGNGGDADYTTNATPVELLFSGGHGFSIAAGASITSDWLNLNWLITDELIVTYDCTTGRVAFIPGLDNFQRSYIQDPPIYNLATVPAGGISAANQHECVSLIETQAGSGPSVIATAFDLAPGNNIIRIKGRNY